jgi:hypothetical protein
MAKSFLTRNDFLYIKHQSDVSDPLNTRSGKKKKNLINPSEKNKIT